MRAAAPIVVGVKAPRVAPTGILLQELQLQVVILRDHVVSIFRFREPIIVRSWRRGHRSVDRTSITNSCVCGVCNFDSISLFFTMPKYLLLLHISIV